MYICEKCGREFERKKPFKTNEILCSRCLISKAKKEKFKDSEYKLNFLNKTKETNIARYGVANVAQNEQIKNKFKQTQLDKYGFMGGFANPNLQTKIQKEAHSKESYEKRKETSLKKYNVDHWMKSPNIKNKLKATYENKTGFDNPMHNPEVVRENHIKGYTYEQVYFDSSWELAYYIWLKDNKKEFLYHPKLYMDYVDEEGTNRVYQPDFLVEGKFYEIKGDQFFNEKNEPYNKYTKKFWWNKYNALKENKVTIMCLDDIKFYLRYVKEHYGKNFLKQFKNSNNSKSSTTIEKELKVH